MVFNFLSRFYRPINTAIFNMADLDKFSINKCIFQNHTPFPNDFHKNTNLQVIYMFGDVFNTVYSTVQIEDRNLAYQFLHVDKENYYKEYERDIFNFKRHYDNWNRKHSYPVLSLRYETLYDNLDALFSFIKIPKSKVYKKYKFPEYKKRKTNWEDADELTKEKLKLIYGETKNYLDSKPDVQLW